jgi:hypothetical protein
MGKSTLNLEKIKKKHRRCFKRDRYLIDYFNKSDNFDDFARIIEWNNQLRLSDELEEEYENLYNDLVEFLKNPIGKIEYKMTFGKLPKYLNKLHS